MHTAIEQNQTPRTETSKRYQCRHIFTDGRRCGSPCLRSEDLCYYHHTTRRPAQNPRGRRSRRSTFELPLPEDRSAIQHSIGQVLQRIAANDIDPRRAGLLLYGLQIASLNLPKEQPTKPEPETVDEITLDPTLGLLAPPAEVGQATRRKSTIAQLLDKMLQDEARAKDEAAAKESVINETAADPAILPTLQACSPPQTQKRCHFDRRRRTCRRSGETRFSTHALSQSHSSASSHIHPTPHPRKSTLTKPNFTFTVPTEEFSAAQEHPGTPQPRAPASHPKKACNTERNFSHEASTHSLRRRSHRSYCSCLQ